MKPTKKEIYTEKFSQYISEHYTNQYEIINVPDSCTSKTKVMVKCDNHDVTFEISWDNFNKGRTGCRDCSSDKFKQTCLEKYGVEYPTQSTTIKEKSKQTCLEKYGGNYYNEKFNNYIDSKYNNTYKLAETVPNDCNSKTKIMIKCIIHDINFKISWDNFSQGKIGCKACKIEKYKQTCLEKYGVENPAQFEQFQQKKIETCVAKYGVDHHSKTNEYKNKYRTTSIERYGVDNYAKSDEYKNKTKATCLKRYGTQSPTQKHIDPNHIDILNNKDKLEGLILTKSLSEIADDFNINASTVSDYARKHRIQIPRSSYETAISHFLNCYNIIYKTNTRKIIPPYELDFYIHKHKVAIEFCGIYWHAENKIDKITPDYHKMKYDRCKELGITLITIFEDEWNDETKDKILYHLGITTEHWLPEETEIIADLRFGEDKILEGYGYTKIEEYPPSIVEAYHSSGFDVYDCGKVKYTI